MLRRLVSTGHLLLPSSGHDFFRLLANTSPTMWLRLGARVRAFTSLPAVARGSQ